MSLLLLPGIVSTQGQLVNSYSFEDGLCGTNWMNIFQDSDKMIWATSYSDGLGYYDNNKWYCITEDDGLHSNLCNFISQDSLGGIWIDHLHKGWTRLYKGKKEVYLEHTKDPNFKLVLTPGGTPFVYILDGTELKEQKFDFSSNSFKPTRQFTIARKGQLIGNVLFDKWTGKKYILWYNTNKNQKHIHSLSILTDYGAPEEMTKFNSLFKPGRIYSYFTIAAGRYFYSNNSNFFVYQNGHLEKLSPPPLKKYGSLATVIEHQPISINIDYNSNQIIFIWKIKDQRRYQLATYSLPDFRIAANYLYESEFQPSSALIDEAGSVWIATESALQRIIPYQFIIPPHTPNYLNRTWAVAQSGDNKMWFASYGSGVASFDGISMVKPPFTEDFILQGKFDDGSLTDHQGNVLFNFEYHSSGETEVKSGIIKINKNGGYNYYKTEAPGFYLNRDNRGHIMRGMAQKGLWISKEKEPSELGECEWIKLDSSRKVFLGNVITALQDKYGRYWMGRPTMGLAVYDTVQDTAWSWMKKDHPAISPISLEQDLAGNIWMGTYNGLFFYKNDNSLNAGTDLGAKFVRIGADLLGDVKVTVVKYYDAGTLIIGTLRGYYLLDLKAFYGNPSRVKFKGAFDKEHHNYGGGAINQNAVWIDNNKHIWFTTSHGIIRHDPLAYIEDTIKAMIILDSLVVGQKVFQGYKLEKTIHLRSDERTLSIYFHHNFNKLFYNNVKCKYRLNTDSIWSYVDEAGKLTFQNLASGNYTLFIQPVKDGLESPVRSVSFSIDRLLWQKWWFWLGLTLSSMSLGLYLYRKQRRIYHQDLKLMQIDSEVQLMSREKDKLQVQAIINQLNPHFINNALQWLQVRFNDDLEAVKVVGKLAENISTVFRNSRRKVSHHSLDHELTLTENYLYIQKARFGKRLQVDLPDRSQLGNLLAIEVPLMILQIHAENAVEHGIRNNPTGEGTVRIRINDQIDFIRITIEDDGIGRQAAAILGSKGTQNGTKMLAELQRIYNKNNVLKISQEYQDNIFSGPDQLSFGTRVIITIPKEFNYHV